jgi:intracellular septation protein A
VTSLLPLCHREGGASPRFGLFHQAMNPMLFLTQLLPLIVFIVVDALVTDVRVSILCAIVFAIGQLAFTWLRTHQFDWFVLLDVGLIAVLGGVSIFLKNELFFKLKPAIIEAITIVFMLALVFAPDRFLLGYFGRMMPTLRPEAISIMKSMLAWLSFYTALHIAAVVFTAFRASKQTWAWVSGPGFYLLFIPIMAVVLVKRHKARRRAREAALRQQAPASQPRQS